MEGRLLRKDTKVLPAPLRRRSKFAVTTARREIHGSPLHRTTAVPPTLQGFFHGNGDLHNGEPQVLPNRKFGRFASLPWMSATPVIDPSFLFLRKALPLTDHIFLLRSCNGLLLFGQLPNAYYNTAELNLSFIVCNPATEQWVAVPGCGCIDDELSFILLNMHISLLFDPAVSSHFHLVLFWDNVDVSGIGTATIHTYSSKARAWSHSDTDWSEEEKQGPWEGWRVRQMVSENSSLHGRALVDGLLYMILGNNLILQIDEQGKTRRIIPAPKVRVDAANYVVFVGQSQGLLHCIVEQGHEVVPSLLAIDGSRVRRRRWRSRGLSVWVLQDSDTQEWIFKHRMSTRQLFGKRSCRRRDGYHVVTMHLDCNLIYFVRHRDAQMISYDIDRHEVHALQSFEDDYGPITPSNTITLIPYVPYLSELFVGVLGGHK
ncbi:hypothetical protein HU200_013603 [Digitaria exilis]|uniref:F-box associated domain-containing protein n=1 Tax=Digitaria exilis TaxID=1010633 RepID=A0A835FDM2_9POAL|nr:hypothetical protein HU200_013603 [Digitaria exilis]CAB3452190.1 unnamed protein product [Digitaria exilis]